MSDREVRTLVRSCHLGGRDPLLVQGGGGNASVKSGDGQWMWIKASGFRLADVTPTGGFVRIDLSEVRKVLHRTAVKGESRQDAQARSAKKVMEAVRDRTGLRPSLETLFHAALGTVVLHTHPVVVNTLACMEGGRDSLSTGMEAVWVPYAPPGYELGASVATLVADGSEGVLVFQNHGLVVHSSHLGGVRRIMERSLLLAESLTGPLPSDGLDMEDPPDRLVLWAGELKTALSGRFPGHPFEVRASSRVLVNRYGKDPSSLGEPGALVPDDIVYGVHRLLDADISSGTQKCVEQMPDRPPAGVAVAVRGGGTVFAAASPNALDAMEETLLAHVLIRSLISRLRGRPVFLPEGEVEFIEAMESERYRRRIAERGHSPGGAS